MTATATIFSNATFHTGDAVVRDRALVVRDGAIQAFVEAADMPVGAIVHDLGGRHVSPGFIDLQVNGGGDVSFNDDPSIDGIAAIVAGHRRYGTTGLLLTVITDTDEVRRRCRDGVVAWLAGGRQGVLGMHVEGPWISPTRHGVHDVSRIRAFRPGDDAPLLAPLDGARVLVTLAPELLTEDDWTALHASGAIIGLGHTDANDAQMQDAIARGATWVTHLFNAMSPIQAREPGATGAALASGRLWCGLIVDGHHVHDDLVRLAARALGPKFVLTSDAMAPVGGTSTRFSIGSIEAEVVDGVCVTADGVLAGSALDMATAVRNTVGRAGIDLDEALRMATLYPATVLGMDDQLGRVAPGYAADLAIFDEDVRVSAVVIGGELTAVG